MNQSPANSLEETAEQRTRHGIIAALMAYTMWGLFPIYFKIVSDVEALEMLAHRIVWSLPFGALIIWLRHQWPEVKRALSHKRTFGFLALSALVISVNWLTYIYAVQNEHIFQASLGYYINPLMYVIIGVMFFGETLRRNQVIAVVLAAAEIGFLDVCVCSHRIGRAGQTMAARGTDLAAFFDHYDRIVAQMQTPQYRADALRWLLD